MPSFIPIPIRTPSRPIPRMDLREGRTTTVRRERLLVDHIILPDHRRTITTPSAADIEVDAADSTGEVLITTWGMASTIVATIEISRIKWADLIQPWAEDSKTTWEA